MWELAILFVIWLIIAPLLGVIAFFKKSSDSNDASSDFSPRDTVQSLAKRVAHLEYLQRQSQAGEAADAPFTDEPPASTPSDIPPTLDTEEPESSAQPDEDPVVEDTPPIPAAAMASAGAATKPSNDQREAMFASRWLVWLGGIIFAIGGAFLVSYSVEAGLLGPARRISAAILLGIASVVAGEYTRHRPLSRVASSLNANTIPAALTAAGIAIVFAGIYGGYALYGFFGALPSFVLLAFTALVAVGLALLHDRYGSFIAALGLLGAYVVPLLVQTGSPNAVALFLYVGILNLAALSLLRWRGWMWLVWGVFAGAMVWPLLFSAGVAMGALEVEVLGIYAIVSSALAALILTLARPVQDVQLAQPKSFPSFGSAPDFWVSILGAVAASFLLVNLALRSDLIDAAALNIVAAAIVFVLMASYIRSLFLLAVVSIGMLGALVVLWPLGSQVGIALDPKLLTRMPSTEGTLFPADTLVLVQMTAAAMAGMFLVGMAKLWRERPGYWASVAVVAPLGLFVLAYIRLSALPHSFPWNYAALGLAVVFELAAFRIWRYRQEGGLDYALAAFLMGVTGALSLCFALSLEHDWLTVALALQVPVLAYIHRRLDVPILRVIGGVIAAVVLVRLVLNPDVTTYPMPQDGSLLNWIWYGYGVPALSFAMAARWFADKSRELNSVSLMLAAAIGLFVVMITLEISVFASNSAWNFATYSLFESALDTIAWGSIGLALYAFAHRPTKVIALARSILLRYAALHVAVVHLVFRNPLWTRIDVGHWPILNVLGLAYLVPALAAALAAYLSLGREAKDRLIPISWLAGLSGLLGFAYVNFEVRALFHGGVLYRGAVTQAELYAYSGAWFLMAAALLAFGIARRMRQFRFAGLALLALVVGKVFLVDMSQLEGIFRVLSFIGLGIGLVVIGFAYQRFVLPQERGAGEAALEE